jgi:hypothetical protein
MSLRIPYNVTNDSVTVVIDGRPTTVLRSAPNFVHLRNAIIAERWDDVRAHLKAGSSLARWARGRFSVVDNAVHFDGVPVPSDFNNRIVEMATANESPEPLFNFWERLQRNPSARSVEQLWRFLNLTGIPITEDGHFLAYKGVRMDYKDCHSGTIDNHPGQKPKVPRNKVSDDPQTACHYGLHVGSLEYASSFGQRVIIVKVDPENVVCVPYDCTSQKMRVCEYEVVGLHGEGHMQSTTVPDSDWMTDDMAADDWDDLDDVDEDFDDDMSDAAVVQALSELDEFTKQEPVEPKTFFLNERQELLPVLKRTTKTAKWIRELDARDEATLGEVNMDLLRRYASKALRIVGAYRIPGGKLGLIAAIMKARS